IWPFNRVNERIREFAPRGIILSGGPASVFAKGAPQAPQGIFDHSVPVLGICYGEQLICHDLGGKVEPGSEREVGRNFLKVTAQSKLFDGLWPIGTAHQVWMSHGDRISAIPPGFEVIGTSENAPFAAIQNDKRRIYGIQFHAEVAHTPDGAKLLCRFVREI